MKVYLTNVKNPATGELFLEGDGSIIEIPMPHTYRVVMGQAPPRIVHGRLLAKDRDLMALAVDTDAQERWEGHTLAPLEYGGCRIWRRGMVLAEVEPERVTHLWDAIHGIIPSM